MEALVRRLMPGLALLAASALAAAGCSSSSTGGSGSGGSGTMNLGGIYPFTETNADQGAIGMAGCLTGVAAVNAAGGVQGGKFVCKSFDTKGDPADATSAANQMMASANPVMVIGASDDAVTTAPIVTAAGVPNFATIGDPHFDHQTNQYFYRITPSDALQGVALGYWAATHFKRPAAVFTSDLGAQTSVPPLRAKMTALGHKLVADVTLPPGKGSTGRRSPRSSPPSPMRSSPRWTRSPRPPSCRNTSSSPGTCRSSSAPSGPATATGSRPCSAPSARAATSCTSRRSRPMSRP